MISSCKKFAIQDKDPSTQLETAWRDGDKGGAESRGGVSRQRESSSKNATKKATYPDGHARAELHVGLQHAKTKEATR